MWKPMTELVFFLDDWGLDPCLLFSSGHEASAILCFFVFKKFFNELKYQKSGVYYPQILVRLLNSKIKQDK